MGVLAAVTVIFASIYVSGYEMKTVEDHFEMVETADDTPAAHASQEPILIRVTGYGAYADKKDRTSEAKRLMVMRASKLDAYRNLAERVYGTAISGASTVEDFQLKNDGVTSMVDSVIRGAKVISITEHKSKGIETVLELILPGNFQDCLNKVNNFRYGRDCLRALPTRSPSVVRAAGEGSNTSRQYYLQ